MIMKFLYTCSAVVVLICPACYALIFTSRSTTTSTTESIRTIPCPDVDATWPIDPNGFAQMPLSERPNLAKILQHGFYPRQNQATVPKFHPPANPVQVQEGFVDRPFQSFSNGEEFCPYVTCKIETGGGSSETGLAHYWNEDFQDFSEYLVQSQIDLESGIYYQNLPGVHETLLHPSWDQWVNDIIQFAATDHNCSIASLRLVRNHVENFFCEVRPECAQLEPNFVDYLSRLPLPSNLTNDFDLATRDADIQQYLDFFEQWGYGAVSGFELGSDEMTIHSSDYPFDDGPLLYLGRSGGLGTNFSNAYFTNTEVPYTIEDCQDPAPVEIRYLRWSWMFYYEEEKYKYLEEQGIVSSLTSLVQGFYLAMNSVVPGSMSEALDQMAVPPRITRETCDPQSTRSPSIAPTLRPTTTMPTNSPIPLRTSESPTAKSPTSESPTMASRTMSTNPTTAPISLLHTSESPTMASGSPIGTEIHFLMLLTCGVTAVVAAWWI